MLSTHQWRDDSFSRQSICKPNACSDIWDVAALLLVGFGDAGSYVVGREGRIKKLGLRERKLLFSATTLLFSGFLGGVLK